MNADFSKKLLHWNKKKNKRKMPWKGETDPYKIWLSEIILQQTRVEQGWAYYEKFVKTFPTVHHLAKAPTKKVFKLWECLGYYNRCKNLIETAKKISKDYKGKFPATYEAIKELKGIGPYTAAAISSFAFNLPHAVVDGNVERVLSRYFGINTPVDTTDGKKIYAELADALLDKKSPGIYNQSIMDLGAVICKPQNPLCTECPQQSDCQAYQHNLVDMLPVKAKKLQKKERWFYYFIIEINNSIYIHERKEKDIWQSLYEFILLETKKEMKNEEIIRSDFIKNIFGKEKFTIDKISAAYKQQLTHQTLHIQFVHINISKQVLLKDHILIRKKDINKYPFPKSITAYLSQSTIL
jgi:A/G-specific adenine glycosylase